MIRVLMGFEPSKKLDMVNKVWVVDDWRGYNIHFMRLLYMLSSSMMENPSEPTRRFGMTKGFEHCAI